MSLLELFCSVDDFCRNMQAGQGQQLCSDMICYGIMGGRDDKTIRQDQVVTDTTYAFNLAVLVLCFVYPDNASWRKSEEYTWRTQWEIVA